MKKKCIKPKHSIRKRLSIIMVIGWLLPVTIIYAFMTVIYQNAIIKRSESITKENIIYITDSISSCINEAIDAARHFSYEKNIEDSLKDYYDNKISFNKLSNNIKERLNVNLNNNSRLNMSCFFLLEFSDKICYTSREHSDYDIYMELIHEEALQISEIDTSDIFIIVKDSRIYLIRNMYTLANYQKFGTLTLEISTDSIFDIMNTDYMSRTTIFINSVDNDVITPEHNLPADTESILKKVKSQYQGRNDVITKVNTKKYQAYLYERKYRDFHIGTFTITSHKDNYKTLTDLNLVIMLIWIIVIPIVAYLTRYIYNQITKSLTKIIFVSNRLKDGEVGVQIDASSFPNLEFEELATAFNKTSSELKIMIDRAYKEELAYRDAKIMALQSQINPHFLNNTLEMMNWQARLSGDITVSKMIEALSTFLDQSMNRQNKRLIPLSEVVRCSDAYFYITSMRFGKRLITEKTIDESLLTALIPPLILQPIVENAVVHGVENKKQGRIWLKIFKEGETIVMQVINTGNTMTDEDIEKVEKLLSLTYEADEIASSSHHSLGIRNVNERIKLIYGEEYGLSIRPYENGKTIAEIIIPIYMP